MSNQISFSTTNTSVNSIRQGIQQASVGKMGTGMKVAIGVGTVCGVVPGVVIWGIYKIYQHYRNEPHKRNELIEEACKETHTPVTLNAQKQRTLAYQLSNGSQVTYTEEIVGSGDQRTSQLWMEKDGDRKLHECKSIAELQAFRRNDIQRNGQTYSAMLPNELQPFLTEAKRAAHADPLIELEQVYLEASTDVKLNEKRQLTLTYQLSNGLEVNYTQTKEGLDCYHFGGLHGGLQVQGDDFPKTIEELQQLRRSSIAKQPELYEPPLSLPDAKHADHLRSLWGNAHGISQLAMMSYKDVDGARDISSQSNGGGTMDTNLTISKELRLPYGLQDKDVNAANTYLSSVKHHNEINGLQLFNLALLHKELRQIGPVDFTGVEVDTLLQIAEYLAKTIKPSSATSDTPLEELFGIILDDRCSTFAVPDYIGWFEALVSVYGVKDETLLEKAEDAIHEQWTVGERQSSVEFFKELGLISIESPESEALDLFGDTSLSTATQINKDLAMLYCMYAEFINSISDMKDDRSGLSRTKLCVEFLKSKPDYVESLKKVFPGDDKKVIEAKVVKYVDYCRGLANEAFEVRDSKKGHLYTYIQSGMITFVDALAFI